jgi:signal transduction histidine kinase
MENLTTISKQRKNIRRKKTFFVGIAIAVAAAVLYLSAQFAPRLSTYNGSNIKKIESTILSKKEQLREIAKAWFITKDTSQKAAFAILDDRTISKLNKENIGIFLCDSTRLVAWSSIPNIADSMLARIDTTMRLYAFNDGLFLSSRFKHKGKSAIITIEVQKHYRFTNRFLENRFNPILGIPAYFKLSKDSKSTSRTKSTLTVRLGKNNLFTLEREKNIVTENPTKDLLVYASLILLIVGGWLIIQSISFKRRIRLFFFSLIGWSAICVLLVNILAKAPSSLIFFSPDLYTSSITPSLAVLAAYVLIFISFCSTIYAHYVDYKIQKKYLLRPLAACLSVFISLIALATHMLVYSLVNNAAVSFGVIKISEISRYSLIIYLIISLLIVSIVLLSNLFFRLFRDISVSGKAIILALPLFIVLGIYARNDISIGVFAAASLLTYAIFLFRLKAYMRIGIRDISLILIIWAVATSAIICHFVVVKDERNRIEFAESLYNEKDPILEAALPDISELVVRDKTIHQLIHNPSANDSIIYQYIRKNVLKGYFSKYNLRITICPIKANLFLPNEKKTTSCQTYFDDLFKKKGTKVDNSTFYLIRNFPGEIWYIGRIDYLCTKGLTSLYLELNLKTISSDPGYPELLLKKSEPRTKGSKYYEYAHYFDSSLVAKNGNYSYPSIIAPPSREDSIDVRQQKGYSNLYYRFDQHNTMVISRPMLSLFDIASCFSYIFIFLVFAGLLVLKFSRFPLDDTLSLQTFKGRITLSFVVVLIAALILTAVASLTYGIKRFEAYKEQTIQDKMKSAIPAVYNALYAPNTQSLTDELVKISNYLYVDVNLYDKKGELFATSRPEIFYDGLQGFRMSPRAFKSLALSYDGFYVDNEQIGNMTYTSSYSPIFDSNGKLIGYVNLPYFLQYDNLRKELYTIAITIANIFILLLLPVVLIAVLISNSITRPLEQIRNRMRIFDLKTNPEPIPYKQNDEIGDLIVEFNKMILQVESSAKLLADNERDLAWREMARQIAHEIKNPLTPMKLSLQYLMMLKGKNDSRWLEQFDRFAASQVEQIDSLAKIANEFSDFAKINFDEQITVLDLRAAVNEILPIFDGFPNLTFEIDMPNVPINVRVGREHLKRVVVNLVKNAIQSVEDDKTAIISITVIEESGKATLSVKDNGKGIANEVKPKLFTPNFTTKSSGTGLGLAICKNLIEAYSGSIWFESEVDKGSTFYIELPSVTAPA